MEQQSSYKEVVDITNVNSEVHIVSEQMIENDAHNENGQSIDITYDKVTMSAIPSNDDIATEIMTVDIKETKLQELMTSPKTIKDAYENSELLLRGDSPEINDIASCNIMEEEINHEELAFCANQGKNADDYIMIEKDASAMEDGNESVDEQILLNVSDESHTEDQPEQKLMDMFSEQQERLHEDLSHVESQQVQFSNDIQIMQPTLIHSDKCTIENDEIQDVNIVESSVNVEEEDEEIQVDDISSKGDEAYENEVLSKPPEQVMFLEEKKQVKDQNLTDVEKLTTNEKLVNVSDGKSEKFVELKKSIEDIQLLETEKLVEDVKLVEAVITGEEKTLINDKLFTKEPLPIVENVKTTDADNKQIEAEEERECKEVEKTNDELIEIVEEIEDDESSLSNNIDEMTNKQDSQDINEEISIESNDKDQENGAVFDKENDGSIQLADSSMTSEFDNINTDSKSADSNQRVIQDIFDDWQEENAEEIETRTDCQQKMQDSVELELQHLLSDSKSIESEDDKMNSNDVSQSDTNITNHRYFQAATSSNGNAAKMTKTHPQKTGTSLQKPVNSTSSRDPLETKKGQSPRPGVKIPSLNLTSQIATKAEVTEVLKERLREKQKDLVESPTADIVFVKKITQRLSKGLAAAGHSAQGLVTISHSNSSEDKSNEKKDETTMELGKSSSSDHTELLAILEGDVDPDWSNLKSPSITEDGKDLELNTSGKLDPGIERQLALKQLLELPNLPTKKMSPKKKKTFKPAPGKADSTDEADTNSVDVVEQTPTNTVSEEEIETKQNFSKENNSQNAQPTSEHREDETRSGRKRKLTEKAREHEQNVNVKRQKVYRGRSSLNKKSQSEEMTNDDKSDNVEKNSETKSPKKDLKDEPVVESPKAATKSLEKSNVIAKTTTGKIISTKRLRQTIIKKDHPIAKRKHVVKHLLRQKMAVKKASVKDIKKFSPKSPSKTQKPTGATTDKPRKKTSNEIDKLLQDEGVVNLLYNVEQSDSKKLFLPLSKSQTKVVDVEKAERELNLRKKLVRNVVMRARGSSTPTKISPRSRRFVVPTLEASAKKSSETKNMKTPDFTIPAKIRNAADASRIIRRHSSSSFSSASGSPRVSVDAPPDKTQDFSKDDEDEPHVLRSKRRHSLNDKKEEDSKKNKKKVLKTDVEVKEEEPKKETRRVSTRSNGSASLIKPLVMSKKSPKSKTPVESESESESENEKEDDSENQTELSVVLANTANVLMSINNVSTRSTATNRKTKNITNMAKALKTNSDVSTRGDVKSSFSNKEILVRRHGYLVQLILNPSSSASGIRNGITIEVMDELQEALSILSKDQECRVVLLTSSGTSFCEGLDLSTLVQVNKEERKRHAEKMATSIKDFIKSLAAFNKPIVAGVQGAAVGLGVTMLPLFDLVIASDKATFNTPYGKLGQIAEGAAVLTLSSILGNAVTSELLLGGRTLTASEALRAGLVTRVLWPDRFQVELLPSLKAMSEQSSQSMEATKTLLRHSLRNKLDTALDSESLLLVKHWCSTECQDAMKAYIDGKVQ